MLHDSIQSSSLDIQPKREIPLISTWSFELTLCQQPIKVQFDRLNQQQSRGATRNSERRAHRDFIAVDHYHVGLTRYERIQSPPWHPPRGRKKSDFAVIQALVVEAEREGEQQQELTLQLKMPWQAETKAKLQ